MELLKKLKGNKQKEIKQTLIHGDFTIDNVLVHKGKIASIIDWNQGAFGDPRYDVSLSIRPKPRAFESEIDVNIFFKDTGRRPSLKKTINILRMDYTHFFDGITANFIRHNNINNYLAVYHEKNIVYFYLERRLVPHRIKAML
jgi:aminoglycoside phosphotransferase